MIQETRKAEQPRARSVAAIKTKNIARDAAGRIADVENRVEIVRNKSKSRINHSRVKRGIVATAILQTTFPISNQRVCGQKAESFVNIEHRRQGGRIGRIWNGGTAPRCRRTPVRWRFA